MKTVTIALITVAALGAVLIARSSRADAAAFSIVVEATPNGWAARCESGCSMWSAASFECATACNAIVDANGLVTLATPRPEPAAFSFTVERTATGILARARQGTAWTTLSWSCAAQPCRGRIDASGVTLAAR